MPAIPGGVERAFRGGVDKAKAVGRRVETGAKTVSREARQTVTRLQDFRDQHPTASLQFIAGLETHGTRRVNLEEETVKRKMTGAAMDVRVAQFMHYSPGIPEHIARQQIREEDVQDYLKSLKRGNYNELKGMLDVPPGTKIYSNELVDPTDPSKGYKVSALEELKPEIMKQLPEIDRLRKKALAKLIAAVLLGMGLDVGRQGMQEQTAR